MHNGGGGAPLDPTNLDAFLTQVRFIFFFVSLFCFNSF
jgi:hypothetical protein